MITYADKNTGDKVYASDINEIKSVTNSNAARLDTIEGTSEFDSISSRIDAVEVYCTVLSRKIDQLGEVLASLSPDSFRAVDDPNVIAEEQVGTDGDGEYKLNQILIKWNVIDLGNGNGIEAVDNNLLRDFNLTAVSQNSGTAGVVGWGLYNLPSGTDAATVLPYILENENVITATLNRNVSDTPSTGYPTDQILIAFEDNIELAVRNAILDEYNLIIRSGPLATSQGVEWFLCRFIDGSNVDDKLDMIQAEVNVSQAGRNTVFLGQTYGEALREGVTGNPNPY
jgi:hypothetical protein